MKHKHKQQSEQSEKLFQSTKICNTLSKHKTLNVIKNLRSPTKKEQTIIDRTYNSINSSQFTSDSLSVVEEVHPLEICRCTPDIRCCTPFGHLFLSCFR